MVGVGVYADNRTCAVSTTGEGEYLIRNIIAYNIAAVMEYKGYSLKKACDFVLNEKCKDVEGDIGFIALDAKGNICLEFNSERMHRAWMRSDEKLKVKIYKK